MNQVMAAVRTAISGALRRAATEPGHALNGAATQHLDDARLLVEAAGQRVIVWTLDATADETVSFRLTENDLMASAALAARLAEEEKTHG